ncbi:hypothetical protein B0H17DRAFT_1015755 [Mycena rosella]|uniref:Uncharacterized protein n=1 Tax=Mycena rosella TaxID=1033263 RepID=A0AAD7D3X7_MYCRO|nr:hypothetical protein B0H17DRAFT_1015755 [Mycena rosella]
MVSSCVITDEDPAPEVPDNADGGATDGDESLFSDRDIDVDMLDVSGTQQQQEFAWGAYNDQADDVVTGGPPRTYVFTLDSLGTRHPKVVNVLGQYLQFEAQEKKGIPMAMSSKRD